jgi:di/tricarboxylate transporter
MVPVMVQMAHRPGTAPSNLRLRCFWCVVTLSALTVAPILALGSFAVAIILVTGCVDTGAVFGVVGGRLIARFFAACPRGLILTAFLSNSAVAVICAPIAIRLALSLGADPADPARRRRPGRGVAAPPGTDI